MEGGYGLFILLFILVSLVKGVAKERLRKRNLFQLLYLRFQGGVLVDKHRDLLLFEGELNVQTGVFRARSKSIRFGWCNSVGFGLFLVQNILQHLYLFRLLIGYVDLSVQLHHQLHFLLPQ